MSDLYEAVTEAFRASSEKGCYDLLNEYLNAKPMLYRANSVQFLEQHSRLATERTFEYTVTFLILWERIK